MSKKHEIYFLEKFAVIKTTSLLRTHLVKNIFLETIPEF